MRALERRLAAIEDRESNDGNWNINKPTHLIPMEEDDTSGSALKRYMVRHPDSPVAADHNVIWLAFVNPHFDADGHRIFRKSDETRSRGTSLQVALGELEGR